MGFLPPLDDVGIRDDLEQGGPASNSSQEKLQLCHDFLAALLQEIKGTCENKLVMMVSLGGAWQKRRLRVHIAAAMGGQKSRGCLRGRKSINSGDAGRAHRACMASAM